MALAACSNDNWAGGDEAMSPGSAAAAIGAGATASAASISPTSVPRTSALPLPTPAPAGDDATTNVDPTADPAELPIPGSARELAAALSQAELALRAPGIDEAGARPWGRRQQVLYRTLAANPSWANDVVVTVDPAVTVAVVENWTARRELSTMFPDVLGTTLPAWRIETPAPAEELLAYYREASEATGVPWEILAAINLIETKMGRIDGLSSAGAVGPMQFLPTTWEECCQGDPTVNADAIRGAAEYLIDRGAASDLDRAIFGYNNSDHYVRAVRAYAAVMADDPDAYLGYHAWQVFVLTAQGLILLPEGYEQPDAIDVATWIADHPDSLYELSASP